MSDIRSKILDLDTLKEKSTTIQNSGKKIVFTNGCFDIIHVGHVRYLSKAKELGDILIIGLNSDESVKKLKGEDRPVNCFEDRAILLSSLRFVDSVIMFEEQTPDNLIKIVDYYSTTKVNNIFDEKI